jgi:multimeric flavodoxin WrbA
MSATPEKKLKVVAFNGSSKPNGNTAQLIEIVFNELRNEGVECEVVNIGGGIFSLFISNHYFSAPSIKSCIGCGGCAGFSTLFFIYFDV